MFRCNVCRDYLTEDEYFQDPAYPCGTFCEKCFLEYKANDPCYINRLFKKEESMNEESMNEEPIDDLGMKLIKDMTISAMNYKGVFVVYDRDAGTFKKVEAVSINGDAIHLMVEYIEEDRKYDKIKDCISNIKWKMKNNGNFQEIMTDFVTMVELLVKMVEETTDKELGE